MRYFFPFSFLLALPGCFSTSLDKAEGGIFDDCRQLVVVVAPDENSVQADLRRFEKEGKTWRQTGATHAVNLGKKGLAWGRGLHSRKPGLQKKEGDQKSPAGLFRFGAAFGYSPTGTLSLKLDYATLAETNICVEDSESRYYNQIVDEAQVVKDWKNREAMLRKDDQYKWGIFVKHNLPPEAESGSCIFFHLWRATGSGTLGCTAMAEDNLLALMQWLDPELKPVLVQMTREQYQSYRKNFSLPEL